TPTDKLDGFRAPDGKIVAATKKTVLTETSSLLLINLATWGWAGNGNDIKFLGKKDYQKVMKLNGKNYILHAVIVGEHEGKKSIGGHYYLIVCTDPSKDTWHMFNDSVVTLSSEAEALKQKHAYFLLYVEDKEREKWKNNRKSLQLAPEVAEL